MSPVHEELTHYRRAEPAILFSKIDVSSQEYALNFAWLKGQERAPGRPLKQTLVSYFLI
jgi:hypothetical protein